MLLNKRITKWILIFLFSFASVFFITKSSYASTESLLAEIRDITNNILDKINKIPAYIEEGTKMAASWNEGKLAVPPEEPDKNQVIAKNQEKFAEIDSMHQKSLDNRIKNTQDVTKLFLEAGTQQPNAAIKIPPNANELAYGILHKIPIIDKNLETNQKLTDAEKTKAAQQYIQHLAGTTFKIDQVKPNWTGSDDKTQYINFYDSIAAIRSYGLFTLNNLYNPPYSEDEEKASQQLMTQASDSSWFEIVAEEPLGAVLRQILMYNSQLYVLTNRMLKIQQQQLATQAVTNTLLSIQAQVTAGETIAQRAANPR